MNAAERKENALELRRFLAESRVLVVGLGRSGLSSVRLLRRLGADVQIYDDDLSKDPAASPAAAEALALGASFTQEEAMSESFCEGVSLMVVSPGVPSYHPAVSNAFFMSVAVWSEVELAFNLMVNDFIAVTGTNGKTTVTELIGALLKAAGQPCRVAGNIGLPVTALVDEAGPDEAIVLEVSSYQLENVHAFQPRVGIFLNLTPDHLERHLTMGAYCDAKSNLFEQQTPEDTAVLNADDPVVAALAPRMRGKVAWFSLESGRAPGLSVRDDSIVALDENGTVEPLCPARLSLPGEHNLSNALAALAAVRAFGVEPVSVCDALAAFPGVEHRIEFVRELDGVRYFNDSKATNPESTIVALKAFSEPIVLIAGGLGKGVPLDEMAELVAKRCRHVVLYGEAAPSLTAALDAAGFSAHGTVGSFAEAVESAAAEAKAGDVVLLSPACASFDLFEDFEERGRTFKEQVMAL